MANEFTPAEAAKVAASLAAKDAYLCSLVSRNYTDKFAGPGRGGAPVEIQIPATLIARTRDPKTADAIEMDRIVEGTEVLTLDVQMDYSAVPLTEWDLSLGIQDFSAQVLAPQCEAVVDSLEHKVASALQGVPETEGIEYDEANPVKVFTTLRKALRDNGVATSGLNVVVGTGIYADLLDADALKDASQAGDAGALRNANVGRLRGFTIVESNRLAEGEILAFHRDAVTLVTRAPAVPKGAPFGATVADKGFSLRYIRDYDAKTAEDRSVVATFSGVALLPTFRVVRDYEAKTAKVEKVEQGGVLHVVHEYGA